MWHVATLMIAFAVSGCASRSLPPDVSSVVDLAPQQLLDMAAPQPLDQASPPNDLAYSIPDLWFKMECSGIVECVTDDCSSSDTGCIAGCEAGHSAAALMDAQTLLACAIPNCGSTFPGNGGNTIDAATCLWAKCDAQSQTCPIPVPPGPP